MKRYLLYGLAGTMLFAASATVSLWMQQQQVAAKGEKGDAKGTADAGRSAGKEKEAAAKGAREGAAKADGGDDLRPVIRPSGPASAEETARLAGSLRDRLKTVREREEQVTTRQKQLELIYQDIRGERNILDELRKQVADEMKALNDKLASVDRKVGDLEQQRQTVTKSMAEVQKKQIDLTGTESKNINKMATMYDSMSSDSAAKIMQQMADNGKMDTAVKILAQMKERQAAKVLAEFADASLAAQLFEKMRGLKRQTPQAATAEQGTAAASGVAPVAAPPAGELPR